MSPCRAGLNRYTELDRVSGWRIERRQGADGALSCRAFLPSGASWFSGNIHLDLNGELVVPSGRSFKGGNRSLRRFVTHSNAAAVMFSICPSETG